MILPVGVPLADVAARLGVPPDCVQLVTETPASILCGLVLHSEAVVIVLTVDQQCELATEGAVLLDLHFLPPWPVRVRPPYAWFATISWDKRVPDAHLHERRVLLVREDATTQQQRQSGEEAA